MTTIPADWIKAAVTVTPGFEVAGDPYEGVSGDFDGMGISCGALQWNIGSNSLQPMVQAVGKPHVLATMPVHGAQMWTACNSSIRNGLQIVRSWQNGSRLRTSARNELKAFTGSAPMRAQQDLRIERIAQIAYNTAEAWAISAGKTAPNKRSFCWFFDLTTQNGSLEGLTFGDVDAFITANKPDKADDFVCDFLGGLNGTSGHIADARANAGLWRNQATSDKLELLVLSYLRSKTSNPRWRHVVINRKGAIAMGKGRVNSSLRDFSTFGL